MKSKTTLGAKAEIRGLRSVNAKKSQDDMYANIKPLNGPFADSSWTQVKGKKLIEVKKTDYSMHADFDALLNRDGSVSPNGQTGSKSGEDGGEDKKSALESETQSHKERQRKAWSKLNPTGESRPSMVDLMN